MTDTQERKYSPSPRPFFDRPTLISRRDVTRHVWGDVVAGEVADYIYVSTNLIHCLVFQLPVGGRFTHSSEFRTVFGADEVLQVLSGTMVIANPETGEVHKISAGGRVTFGPGTWHHVFAHGAEPLRILEFLCPPPRCGDHRRVRAHPPIPRREPLRARRASPASHRTAEAGR